MTALDDRWREGLEAEALTIDIVADDAAPVRQVVRRGRRRHRRNQAVAATASAALLVASGLAWQANRHVARTRPTELRIADEGEPVAPLPGNNSAPTDAAIDGPAYAADPATLPKVNLGPSALQWSVRDVPYGKGLVGGFFGPPTAGPAGLVTVSTKPGVSSPSGEQQELAFYTSDDGVIWKAGGVQTGRHWFGDVTATDRGLVAVGTAAATGPITKTQGEFGTGDVVVTTSTDGGRNWRDVVVPLDLRSLAAKAAAGGVSMAIQVGSAKIASGPAGLLVAVDVVALPTGDLYARLAPATGGVTLGADGVTTYRPSADRSKVGEVDRVVPWSELGVDPEVGALAGGQLHVFRSTDGATFTELPSPGSATIERLMATPMGYAAVVLEGRRAKPGSVPVAAVWTTTDGSSWAVSDPLPLDPFSGYSGAGVVGGRFVVTGTYHGWPAVAVADGAQSRLISLANGIAAPGETVGVMQAVAGSGGVAFALSVAADATAGITVHSGGVTLRSDGQARGVAVVDDATGKELARFSDPMNVTNGAVLRIRSANGSPAFVPTTTPATTVAYAGGTVRAPAPTAIANDAATTTGTMTSPAPTLPVFYLVRKGDTASGIAASVGETLDGMKEANPGVDLDRLQPGDKVRLPGGAGTAYGSNAGIAPTLTGGALDVLDPATGSVRATFDLGSLQAQWQSAFAEASVNGVHRTMILHSVDLETWSLHDVSEQVGTKAPLTSMLVSSDAGLVVTVMTDEADPDAPDLGPNGPGPIRRQKAFVGVRG